MRNRLNLVSIFWASATGASVAWSSATLAQQPLSAIDWLDKPNAALITQPDSVKVKEPPVTDTANTPNVEVTPLGEATPDSVGLLPSATTGLPRSMWQASTSADLIAALDSIEPDTLPAAQALLYTLLLAEADAPQAAGTQAAFLKARVHTLARFGAVDPARALLERAGPDRPQLFDLWFNLSLLSGDEDKPCAMLRAQPTLSSDYAARVYCTARAGDWDTAALTYDTAVAIGALKDPLASLMAQFLDPELIESSADLEPPETPTPLVYRLYEAIGTPLPTRGLPRAFAMADLRGTTGWKGELEAAERLTRVGALPATRLLGLYTDRHPAASGGIWDRVRAVQDLDKALFSRDADALAQALPVAWDAVKAEALAVPFAQLFGEALMKMELPPEVREIAFHIALLSPQYEAAAAHFSSQTDPMGDILRSVAMGKRVEADTASAWNDAILAGLRADEASERHQPLLDAGKLGEAILMAAVELRHARSGDARDASESLKTLRAVGLEDTARRAALQLLILGPGG